MPFFEKSNCFSGAVVGTIPGMGALAAARKLRKGAVDFLELRVDTFAEHPDELDQLEAAAPRLRAPAIVTVRHFAEGGANRLSVVQRRALFRRFLPYASLIDVELRSATQLADVLREARERGIGVILSHHDFRATPSLERLRTLADQAMETGCDIFKLATVTRSVEALTVLLQLMAAQQRPTRGGMAMAVMGMGEFGKLSRLALARAGSVLNYGYLDTPQVPGQWPAEVLKKRIVELAQQ